MIVVGFAALFGFVALAVSMSGRGDAAFPGTNGKIAFSYGDAYMTSIWSANPDGSSPTKLTNGTSDFDPSYSRKRQQDRLRARKRRLRDERRWHRPDAACRRQQLHLVAGQMAGGYDVPHSAKTIPVVKIETLTDPRHNFGSPSFSPDGSQLAVGEKQWEIRRNGHLRGRSHEEQECLDYENPEAYFNYEYECAECTAHIIAINSSTGALTGNVTPPSTVRRLRPHLRGRRQARISRSTPSGSAIFVVNSPAPFQVK